jgi:hypothetical protein
VWSDREDVFSWADVGLANGLLYAGAGALTNPPKFHVYDAATGTLLREFLGPVEISDAVAGGPAIDEGVLYIPFGIIGGSGGVVAYSLPQ